MRQFLSGSDQHFSDLEQRARRVCVAYRDQELPPGSSPSRARIGFEINSRDGTAVLLVDRGVRYGGPSKEVGDWLRSGERNFRSFDELRDWIRLDLARCFNADRVDQSTATHPSVAIHAPDRLTDLAAVQQDLPDDESALFISEQDLFASLHEHVRGQDQPLRTLARRISRHIARRSPLRPATIFAVGPTGCGKTRLAETLPQTLQALSPNGGRYGYLRLDMSEYQERHRISQLLGAPQGYVGYGEGAQLIDALAANPRTTVLFDEIEKAHSDVFRALLNAMDAGRLSTAARTPQGRTIDCRHAIFLFTSNLDCGEILKDLEEANGFEDAGKVDAVCRRRLRAAGLPPELIGRIGTFLVFQPLTSKTRAEIVTQAVARVAAEYGLRVERIEPSVIVAVLQSSKSQGFGARTDEYVVDDLIGDALARAAADGLKGPICVTGGPPFGCVPIAPETQIEERSK